MRAAPLQILAVSETYIQTRGGISYLQHYFLVKTLKIWAYLDNFSIFAIFQHFSFGPPLETMKKKLSKYFKFWEASRNQKRSICWKFKLSISLGTQKSAKTPPAGAKMIRPFQIILLDSLRASGMTKTKTSIEGYFFSNILFYKYLSLVHQQL